MKKTIFISILLLCTSLLFSQDYYTTYFNNGVRKYNNQQYLAALEDFDLALMLANTQKQKDDISNYKQKCRIGAKQQQEDLKIALEEAEQAKKQAEQALDKAEEERKKADEMQIKV